MRPSTVSASSTRSSARSWPILKIPTRGNPLMPDTVGMGTCEYSKQSFGTCVTLIVCSHISCCCVILSGSTGYFACKYGQQSFGTCVTLIVCSHSSSCRNPIITVTCCIILRVPRRLQPYRSALVGRPHIVPNGTTVVAAIRPSI